MVYGHIGWEVYMKIILLILRIVAHFSMTLRGVMKGDECDADEGLKTKALNGDGQTCRSGSA